MLRSVTRVEQRPWLLLGLVFLVTWIFGFLIQAAGSAWLRWQDDPIAANYRTTLSYTSAIIGDGVLIPLVNVFIVSQLLIWRRSPRGAEIAGALLGGALITSIVHLYQAANALLNWTMTQPYRWSGLGYAHAAFMWAEISLVLFFWGQVALVAKENPRAILSHRIWLVALCGLAFLRLVFTDYGYF
ncbi:MAG TPA: hypothetical protein VGR87_15250 [Candidatus Limnocylindria bacterium]|jgi:hypothetical protein|nr:hypothetical protein [Candidatus Limnocylindria bacterium]